MAHFLKFLVVGTIGFIINTLGLVLGVRVGLKPSIAGPIGAEFAIISNFILNNLWTFSDRAITSWEAIPMKFIQFNILSFGSVIIQFIFLKSGELIFGLEKFKEPIVVQLPLKDIQLVRALLKIPLVKKLADKVTAYLVFYVAGVGVGLVVNYFVYSQIIWKQ